MRAGKLHWVILLVKSFPSVARPVPAGYWNLLLLLTGSRCLMTQLATPSANSLPSRLPILYFSEDRSLQGTIHFSQCAVVHHRLKEFNIGHSFKGISLHTTLRNLGSSSWKNHVSQATNMRHPFFEKYFVTMYKHPPRCSARPMSAST